MVTVQLGLKVCATRCLQNLRFSTEWAGHHCFELLLRMGIHCDFTHLETHLVWPHQPENPPGRPRARRISP